MQRLGILSALLVLALLLPQAGEGAESGSFEAEGRSAVAGGNVAAARQEALSAALRGAVEQAAASLTRDQKQLAGLGTWLTRPEGYVLNYRVLSEGKAAQEAAEAGPPLPASKAAAVLPEAEAAPEVYVVRVAAAVSLADLKRGLRAHQSHEAAAGPPPVVAAVEEATGQVSRERAQGLLVAALRQGGLQARAAGAGQPACGPNELLVVARLKVGWNGGYLGEAGLEGREGGQARFKAAGTAPGDSAEEAAGGALKAAVEALAGQLGALGRPAVVRLRLRGLASYGELAQVKAALEAAGLDGRERSLEAGEAVLEVGLVAGTDALAGQLAGKSFEGFSLMRPETAPGSLTLYVVRAADLAVPLP